MTADGTFFNRHRSGSQSVQVVHFISADYTTYYRILERTQKGTTDVTDWMLWFVACLGRAIDDAETTVSAALDRARFWERIAGVPLNDRQRQVLTLLVDDFQGPLTTSRWARITHCSQDTALRTSRTWSSAACWCGVRAKYELWVGGSRCNPGLNGMRELVS